MRAPAFRDPIEWEETLPIRQSSPAWRATIKGLYGSPLSTDEHELFLELSGGVEPRPGGWDELLAIVGRRGGKSETIARLGVFEALHGGHGVALAPGQVGLAPVISPLREQSQEILNYARGLADLPQVKRDLASDPTRDTVAFKTGIALRVMTFDAVSVSGPTVVNAIRDELAKAPGDGAAMSDRELDNSLRPALAPIVGAPRRRLIGITSAYIKEGIAFETDRDFFGKTDSPVLVVRGSTMQFNPNVDRAWLDRERKRVGQRVFDREYLGRWQDAVTEGWFGADVIQRCVDEDRVESEPQQDTYYVAAIDAAFRGDAFALSIAHRETRGRRVFTVIDGVWRWKAPRGETLSVPSVVAESAAHIQRFNAHPFGDQYSFPPLRELYLQCGVQLQEASWTAVSKPTRFSMVRAAMTEGLLRLPNQPVLISELHAIQGRLLRGTGNERIEAGYGHDDVAHAAVLAAALVMERQPNYEPANPPTEPSASQRREQERAERLQARIRKMERIEEQLAGDPYGFDPYTLELERRTGRTGW